MIKKQALATIFSLVLLSSMAITFLTIPTVSAGFNTDTATAMSQGMNWPPAQDSPTTYRNASANRLLMWNRWKDQVPTYVFLSASPNPVGVGQQVTLIFFNPQVPNPSTDRYLYDITIIRPDQSTEKLPPSGAQGIYNQPIIDGKYESDSTGAAWTTYVPAQTGNYTMTVKFYGTSVPHDSTSFTNYDWWGVSLKESTHTITLTVQDEAVTPSGMINVPLPTEYWARPIEGQNTEWYQISSNWLNNAHDRHNGGYNNKYQPDGIGPNSGHILWTKVTEDGGVVGGESFSVPGEVFNAGHQYQTRFGQNQIIMHGRLYYRESNWYSASPGDYVCVDLKTGQEIWRNSTMSAIPSFGYYYDWDDMNQHGVVEPSWLFSANFGTSIHPRTGLTGISLVSVPGTSSQISHNTLYGPKGEELRYTLTNIGTTANPQYALSQWNSSRVFISQVSGTLTANIPIFPPRPTTSASSSNPLTEWTYNSTSNQWTSASTTSSSGKNWYWYTTSATTGQWRYTQTASMTAAGLGTNVNPSYDWNVTLAPTFANAPTIRSAIYNDIMLISNGTVPTAPSYTFSEEATFWGISLKQGEEGRVVWGPKTIKLVTAKNQNLLYQRAAEGVFVFQRTPDMSWVAYDMYTGNKLWEGISEGEYNPYAYYISSTGYNPEGHSIAYGKLFSTGYVGMVFCYDLKTGELLWRYEAPTYMEKFEYYTLMINVIVDGKIYIGTHEHSADTPLFKNSKTRCLDVETGEPIWEMIGWANPYATQLADGILTYWNNYDHQVYAIGKGPSALSVEAPMTAASLGSSVIIRGSVIDISPGTKQHEQAMRFPNGVPAVSDESQSAWMEYVYMQKPRPMDATGVLVRLSVVDANGNYRDIGETTSTADGFFTFSWKPDIEGQYMVYASFTGSESYWPSNAMTSFVVDPAPATPQPAATPLASIADTYFVPAIAGLFVAIIVVGALMVLMLRKRP